MDISKLPRLSKTEDQAPASGEPPEPAPPPVLSYTASREPAFGLGAEAWISIGIGLIFVFAFPHFTQWWIHEVFHTKLPSFLPITDTGTGAEVPYPKSDFFLNDLAVAMFAYALVLDGIALLLWRRAWVLMLALAITAAAMALNGWYLIKTFADDLGFPIVSAIALIFGGYMLWYQWKVLSEMRRARGTSRPVAA